MTSATENEKGGIVAPIGRRKFLALGGAGAAVLVGTAGAARALITAGGPSPSPRSQPPVGLDPVAGREPTASPPPPGGVKHIAFVGTDGWMSMPNALNTFVGTSKGAKAIYPYFPDPLADPSNRTTFAFCFRNVTGLDQATVSAQKGHTQTCAPLFYSTVGDELWLTMSNLGLALRPDLVDGHTIHWHGFRNAIPFYDGVPESSISVAIGHDFTYVYRPKDAGTYMYHCHFEDVEHVTMGMHGIVFVKPDPTDPTYSQGLSAGQQRAYGHSDGDVKNETGYDREFAIMLSEVDTRAHFGDAHIQATDWTDFHADFWTMNGRAYPDTLEPNGIRHDDGQLIARYADSDDHTLHEIDNELANGDSNPRARLASQPLSSLVQAVPGERILIRFANLGFLNHSIVFPGLEVDVLGRDSRFVPDTAQRKSTDSIQIGPGESRDVFFTAPAVGVYPFYDRGLSHYTGSADGNDAWVGGQRSEIRVYPKGFPAQKKPSGWGGEEAWIGEFPVDAVHNPPAVSAQRNGDFIAGTVTVDGNNVSTQLTNVWYISTPAGTPAAPSVTDPGWIAVDFTAGSPNTFNINVGSASFRYWVLARDSGGVYSSNTDHVDF